MANRFERFANEGSGSNRFARFATPRDEIGMGGAFLSGAGDALSFGWGDELQGVLFGEQARDAARRRQELARAEHGGAFLAGQIGGSLVGGGGAGMAARGALRGGSALANLAARSGPLSRMGAAAVTGAAGGALYGAGDAGEQMRLQGAAEGAIPGAVFGGLGQGAGELIGRVGGAVRRSASPQARAGNEIARLQERFDIDPATLRQRLADAPDNAVVADVIPGFTSLVRDAGVRPSAGREALREFYDQRNNQMGARAADDLWRTLAPGQQRSGSGMLESLAKAQRQQAKPLYDAVMNRPIDPRRANALLGEVVRRNPRLFGEGMKDAQALMLSEHGTLFNQDDPRFWHYLQQGADQVFERLRSQQGGLSGNERRVFGRALDAYRVQLRRLLGPKFGQAQDVWSGFARQKRAVEAGFEAVSAKANDLELGELAQSMRRMTAGEKQMMRVGALSALSDMLENADAGTGRANVLRSIMRSKGQRRVLETLFGGEDGFQALVRRLDAQRELFDRSVESGIGVNSHTADRLEGAAALRMRSRPTGGGIRDQIINMLSGDAADKYDEAVSNYILQQARVPASQALADMNGNVGNWASGRGLLAAAERQRRAMRAARPRRLAEAMSAGLYAPAVGGGLTEYGGM